MCLGIADAKWELRSKIVELINLQVYCIKKTKTKINKFKNIQFFFRIKKKNQLKEKYLKFNTKKK